MDALHEDYWGLPAPVAEFTVNDPEPEVGEVVVFTSTSTGADRLLWTVDGAEASHDGEIEWVADTVGPHTIALRADAGAWDDTHTEVIQVHSPPADDPEDPDDTGEDDSPGDTTVVTAGSCGCATGGGAVSWVLPGLLLWCRRRRGAVTRT
jgi:hypothetical protein